MKKIDRTRAFGIFGKISVAGKVRGWIDNKITDDLEMIVDEQCSWGVQFNIRARLLEICQPNKEWLW